MCAKAFLSWQGAQLTVVITFVYPIELLFQIVILVLVLVVLLVEFASCCAGVKTKGRMGNGSTVKRCNSCRQSQLDGYNKRNAGIEGDCSSVLAPYAVPPGGR
jgi:hypothetical protein